MISPHLPPGSASQEWRFRQGVIQTFDSVTYQNTVLIGGTVVSNLPIQGTPDTTALVSGAVVSILVIGKDPVIYAIAGRWVVPS